MDNLMSLLSRLTMYEIYRMSALYIVTTLILLFAAQMMSKDRRLSTTVVIGSLASVAIPVVLTYAFRELFSMILSDIFWLGVLITHLISGLNLSVLLGEYVYEMGKKKFDEDHVTREHFSSTVNMSILLVLMSSFMLFVDSSLRTLLSITLVSALLSIWTNHTIARRLLKDE